MRLVPGAQEGSAGIVPLHSVGSYKGLEAAGAVVLVHSDFEGLAPQLYVAFSRPRFALHSVVERGVAAKYPQLASNPTYRDYGG